MAPGLTVAITILLTFTAEISFGSIPRCRLTSSPDGWVSVDCDGTNYTKELIKLLSQPLVSNTSRLALFLNAFPVQTVYIFNQFANLTHLRIQAEDVPNMLRNITGLNRLKHLNLSSNRIQELTNITNFNRLEDLDLSNNTLRQVDFNLIPPTIQFINLKSNNIEMESNVTLPKDLKHLDLSNNRMACVLPLLSETLTWLNLSGNNLSDLSFILSLITTEELDLSRNNITQLEDDTFLTLSSLIRLDLSRNFIKSLKEKSFSGLNRLQIIDLSHNLLQSITPGTFQYLSNLLWLNLANNTNLGNLDAVEDSSILLGAGQKLQTVDASRTNLTKVPNTLTRSIRNLYLSSNRISTIRCGDLDSFLLLQFLDLTSNNISIVEDDALGRLELLSYLLLAENSLNSIPHSLPDNLLVLDLDHNTIQNLTFNDFFGLSKLKTLRLAWNNITIIQDGAFGQLSSLQNLDLSGNPIKILSGSTFVGPRRLINLGLASLKQILPTNDTLSFPVPESSHLQILNLENSPALVNQLMNDVAALSMFRHINVLNLAFSKTTTLRSDLINFFPRLEVLDLRGNRFNCTDAIWLANWLRRLQEDKSDESKLQLLEENVATGENRTDFDVAQDVNAYVNRLKTSSEEDAPKCASPDHLLGVSLYELRGASVTTEATTLQPRYDRKNFNISNTHDHEFYQNDFPLPASADVRQELSISGNKLPESEKRQAKRSNATDDALLRSALQSNKHSNQTGSDNITYFVNVTNNQTILGHDNIKAEYLRSDNKVNPTEIVNKTNNRLENNITKTFVPKVNQSSSAPGSINKKDGVSMYSPLDVTLHEVINGKRPDSSSANEDLDDTVVFSPQKISGDEDLDIVKNLLDDEEEEVNNEERYTHHPGLLVFFVAAGILGITALVMRASQRRQCRHGYAQQQDIEVRSLDLSAQELW